MDVLLAGIPRTEGWLLRRIADQLRADADALYAFEPVFPVTLLRVESFETDFLAHYHGTDNVAVRASTVAEALEMAYALEVAGWILRRSWRQPAS